MTLSSPTVTLLFSYGTLQEPAVQLSTFGRRLVSTPDALVGYELSSIEIADPEFVRASGRARHAIVRRTGRTEDLVRGVALEVTTEDLDLADRYEPAGYVRITAPLASGREAWVYVDEATAAHASTATSQAPSKKI